MLPIFIVENEKDQRQQLENGIKDYIYTENLNSKIILSTHDPHRCIEYVRRNPNIRGLYLLDIKLDTDINGIEAGRIIKDLDPNGRIIIVTSEGALAFLSFTYKLEALDYIVKSSPQEVIARVKHCIDVAYERYKRPSIVKEKSILEIEIGANRRTFPFDEVCYIETSTQAHRLLLHTLSGRIEFRGFIATIKSQYPALVETHRGVLVNMDNVKSFDRDRKNLKMANDGLCPVATRKLNSIEKILAQR
jgi:two-component system response regulator AgrA